MRVAYVARRLACMVDLDGGPERVLAVASRA